MPRGEPEPVKPIVGLLACSTALLEEARGTIAAELAPVELASSAVEWRMSDYYRDEMGDEIWRQYVALQGTAPAADLVRWKQRTIELEARWRTARGRRVNLDPGYLHVVKVVLASTKDAAHRVYLGGGIYAEATLRFVAGRFAPWPYTYRDYAGAHAIGFFNRVRRRYLEERSARRGGDPRAD